MARGPRLVLRADAGHRLGSGHVMRLAALAEAAVDAGGAARLLIGGEPAASVAALTARGLDAVAAGDGCVAEIVREADELAADAIVLDGPHLPPAWVDELGGRWTLASLDDRAIAPLPTPIVINQGFGAEALADRYPRSPVRLLGRRYQLLRRELRAWPHGGEPVAERVRRVVITMGGSDPVGATARVLAAIPATADGLELVVVLGPGFRDHAALAQAAAAARRRWHHVTIVSQPPAMAPVLAACDLAISAAGGTLAELAYLGRPTYTIAIVDDQVDLAARQAEAGLVAGGHTLSSLSDDTLTAELVTLLSDAPRRRALATASAGTIDGHGPTRILAALTTRSP